MLKRLFLLLLFIAAGAAAQEKAEEDGSGEQAESAAAAEIAEQLQQSIDDRFLALERRLYDDSEINLRRLEHVEERIDSSQHHVDRVLLIFALTMLVIFLLMGTSLKNQQRLTAERIRHAAQNADNLMQDIQREIARPEMEHLRISQILRRQLRQLRDHNRNQSAAGYINDVREASNDPFLPVSLHFIARLLVAEHDESWNTAVQMLEQLREMDPKDPDVLLHLSHVHKKIAEVAVDSKIRKLHQRLSYQYYGQFTAAMQTDGGPIDTLPAEKTREQITASAAPASAAPAPAARPAPAPAAVTGAAPPAKPPAVRPAAPAQTAAAPPPAARPAAAPAAVAGAAPAAKPAAPAAPAVAPPAKPAPAGKPAAPAQPAPAVRPPVATATPPAPPAPAAPPPAAGPAAPVQTATAGAAPSVSPAAPVQTAAAPPAGPAPAAPVQTAAPAAAKPPAPAQTAAPARPAAPAQPAAVPAPPARPAAKPPYQKAAPVRKILGAAREKISQTSAGGASLAVSGFNNITRLFNGSDGNLPFLPVPPTSEVPASGDERAMNMWKSIKQGDLSMAHATRAQSLRERNRIIDAAITCYTQAQAHSTNETLYHNWGVALLAKALHVPEKKRAPLYNAAVDKFLAGNVIAPHYFDFHLASLYAIIGSKDDCLKWLRVARDNNGLDVDALRQAPDFDSVRHEPWFDEFLES